MYFSSASGGAEVLLTAREPAILNEPIHIGFLGSSHDRQWAVQCLAQALPRLQLAFQLSPLVDSTRDAAGTPLRAVLWFVAEPDFPDNGQAARVPSLPLVVVVEDDETATRVRRWQDENDVCMVDVLWRDEVTGPLLARCLKQAAHANSVVTLDPADKMFEPLFDNPHTMMWLIDPDRLEIVDANTAACDFYGYSREAMRGKPLSQINLAKPDDIGREVVRACEGECHLFQFRHCLASGEVREVEVSSGPVTIGSRLLLYSIIHDITEKRQHLQHQTLMSEGLHAVLAAADELLKYRSLDMLLRRAVELGREKLGLERCTIFLVDEAKDCVCGTYSNDRYGRTLALSSVVYEGAEPWLARARPPRGQRWRVDEEELQEWVDGRPVGTGQQGWIAVTPIQSEEHMVGSFSNDTPWSHAPLDAVQQELVSVYCSLLGNIIPRKRAEEALRDGEKRFRLLAENSTDLIARFDPLGKILYVSPSSRKILGYEPSEMIGHSVYDFTHPDDVEGAVKFHDQLDPHVGEYTLTARGRRKDGSSIWLETVSKPIIHPESGEIVEYHGASRDISKRRAAEEALRASEERFRAFMDNTPAMTFIKDEAGHYVYFNKTTEKLYHAPFAELKGKTNFDRLPHDVAQQLRDNDLKVLTTGQAHEFLEVVPTPDGEEHSWLTFKFPLTDAQGQRFVGGVAVDVTQSSRTEEALRQSEHRLRSVVNGAPIVIWALDRNGIFTFGQGQGLQLLGLSGDALTGRSVYEVYQDEPQILENTRRALAGEEVTYDVEVNGTVFETRLTPLRDGSGEVAGAIGVATDITERRRAVEHLRRSEMQMSEAQQLAHFGSWSWDIANNTFAWSDELYRMHGLEPQAVEITYERFLQSVHPEDAQYVREVLESSYRHPWPFHFYHRIVQPGATQRTLHSRCVSLLDESGRAARMVGTSQDVTEYKLAQDLLQKSEERLRAIVQSLDEIVFEFDADGHFLGVWTNNESLLPGPSVSMMGRHAGAIFGEDTGRALLEAFERVIHTGESENVEYVHEIDAVPRWFLARISPIFAPTAEKRTVCVLARDITSRHLKDEALKKSEERFRLLVEGVPDYALCLLDPAGHIVSWNVGAQRISGYGADQIMGRHFGCFYLDEAVRAGQPERELEIARREGRFEDEGWRRRHDGSRFWASVVLSTLYDENNQLRGFSQVTRDISERRRNEQRLRDYTTRLENLLEIDQAILAARSPREIAEVALSRLCQQMACAFAAVTMFNFESDEAVVLSTRGAAHMCLLPGQRLPLDEVILPPDIEEHYRKRSTHSERRRPYVFWQHGEPDESSPHLRSLPLVAQGALIGVLDLRAQENQSMEDERWKIAGEVADQLAIAMQQARLFEQVRAGRAQLQVLSHRLIEERESERRHIARELHDEIGQVLTAVKLNLQGIQRTSADEQLAERLHDSIEIVEHASHQVRDLSLNLRPSLLDDLGLAAALRWYLDRTSKRTDTAIRLHLDIKGPRFNSSIETACFRVVQEALTNTGKHAGASQIEVRLEQEESELCLTICDNGRGFDVRAMRERAVQGSSLGLLSMEERVSLAGGLMNIQSSPEEGTTIRVVFPLTPEDQGTNA